MKVFEFQFNPSARKDRFFKTYCAEHTYFAGELANALPQNSQFLGNLAVAAKTGSFKKLNEFLVHEASQGNVDWAGNLHVACISFSRKGDAKQFVSFSKSGTMQVLLARNGNLTDIGKNVKDFKNFVSGQMLAGDTIIACTKELFDVFLKKGFLHDLAFFKEEKQFKELFKNKEKELAHVSGVLMAIEVEKIKFEKTLVKKVPYTLPVISKPLRQKLNAVFLFFLLLLLGYFLF